MVLSSLSGTPFPKNFLPVVKKILSRLFRVFVHVYIHHFDRITQMGSEAHVNTCYKHFYYFVKEFNLIDTKELEPLVSPWVGSGYTLVSWGLQPVQKGWAGGGDVTEVSGTFSELVAQIEDICWPCSLTVRELGVRTCRHS